MIEVQSAQESREAGNRLCSEPLKIHRGHCIRRPDYCSYSIAHYRLKVNNISGDLEGCMFDPT